MILRLVMLAGLILFSTGGARAEAVTAGTINSVHDVKSASYGFRFRSQRAQWTAWPDAIETYPYAALGAASARGLGSVVMPVCWQGPAPDRRTVLSAFMEQFGETYPTPFVTRELPISKGNAEGLHLIGQDGTGDDQYEYHLYIVMNESCAYALSVWGAEAVRRLQADAGEIWDAFEIDGQATASEGRFESDGERKNNAYHLYSVGVAYFQSQRFREAFRFFSQAADQDHGEASYVIYTLRSLIDIDAYREAYDWLGPRLDRYENDMVVQSWDAWLAYQNDDPAKALSVYGSLFAAGHRDDEDFTVYAELLAEAGEWELLDQRFEEYAVGGMTESLMLAKARVLAHRQRFDEAIAVLDEMQEGRPFSPEIAYQRIDVLLEMDQPAAVLSAADMLIAQGYRSLRSYFYKGSAEYQLQSYLKARESFENALTYSPTHTTTREFLDAIDSILGEDDNSAISNPIEQVELPRRVQRRVDRADYGKTVTGYGSFYLTRVEGYSFDASDTLRETQRRQIRIVDESGIGTFSTLEFNFEPGYEQFYVNRLEVRDAEGELIASGDPDSYYITNSGATYEASNEQTVHLPVPSLAVGVTIEVTVTKRVTVDAGEFPLEVIYFSRERPVDYGALFVTGNLDRLRYQSNDVDPPRTEGQSLIWEVEKPVVYRWEPLQPYYDQILPWLHFGTVDADWETAGNGYLAEIGDKLEVQRTAAQAERLVEGTDDVAQRIARLSAFVQENVHYEAIEFGRRAYIPKTPRDTLRDRYGDCKDHAVLLYSMLQAVGVPARLALVNLNQQVLPELPNLDQFDHMIVAVDANGETYYIDPTDKDLALGRLAPRSMAGNYALVLGEQSTLEKIPDYSSDATGLQVTREILPGKDGHLQITEVGRFSGYQAAELRGQLRDIETSELHASMQRWVADRYSDAEVTDYFIENIFDASGDLIIELQYRLPTSNDGSFEMPGFLEMHYFQYDRVADRRFDFEPAFPLRLSSTTALRLGGGQSLLVAAEKPDADETPFGRWNRQIARGDEEWTISVDYSAIRSRFAADDYRDFAEFHRRFASSLEQPLILR